MTGQVGREDLDIDRKAACGFGVQIVELVPVRRGEQAGQGDGFGGGGEFDAVVGGTVGISVGGRPRRCRPGVGSSAAGGWADRIFGTSWP